MCFTLSVSCVLQDYPKLSQSYYVLLECLCQDHMAFLSSLEPQVFLYIFASISEGLQALGGNLNYFTGTGTDGACDGQAGRAAGPPRAPTQRPRRAGRDGGTGFSRFPRERTRLSCSVAATLSALSTPPLRTFTWAQLAPVSPSHSRALSICNALLFRLAAFMSDVDCCQITCT